MKMIMKEEDVLGGVKVLGQEIRNGLDFHTLIVSGMPAIVITHIKKEFDLSDEVIGQIIGVSARTVSIRRKGALQTPGKRLSSSESDRLYEFARIVSLACNVFQDKEAAVYWLSNPQKSLKQRIPFDFLKTYVGARVVEELLWHIQAKDSGSSRKR